jgi:tryptophan synthase alpha chain
MESLLATTSSESRLSHEWATLHRARRAALIPYLTAGFPTHEASLAMLRATDRIADIIEVGVPFSDPVADGPVIQRASFRALELGMSLARTLELIREAELQHPVVLFSYLNPVLQYGVDRLLHDAAALGVAALLLTDLPIGTDPAIERTIAASPLDLIALVAPTTAPTRLATIAAGASGFIYLVARLGVTGATAALADDLAESVARVRAASPLPVAVGFGISTPEQAASVAALADGVVVGSALVERLERDGVDAAAGWLATLRAALELK